MLASSLSYTSSLCFGSIWIHVNKSRTKIVFGTYLDTHYQQVRNAARPISFSSTHGMHICSRTCMDLKDCQNLLPLHPPTLHSAGLPAAGLTTHRVMFSADAQRSHSPSPTTSLPSSALFSRWCTLLAKVHSPRSTMRMNGGSPCFIELRNASSSSLVHNVHGFTDPDDTPPWTSLCERFVTTVRLHRQARALIPQSSNQSIKQYCSRNWNEESERGGRRGKGDREREGQK